MEQHLFDSREGKFFYKVTNHSKPVLVISAAMIIISCFFFPRLTKNTTGKAFVPKDDPVLVYQEKVREIFGIKDPVVIAVYRPEKDGIFNPKSLALIMELEEKIAGLDGINGDQIKSIASVNNMRGTEEGIFVEPFFTKENLEKSDMGQLREAVMAFDLYLGNLIAENGQTALIIADIQDNGQQGNSQIYKDILSLLDDMDLGDNQVHVAGEAVVSDYLASYIDKDALRLNPLAFILISLVLFMAFRTARGVYLPVVMIMATVGGSLGFMAWAGIPVYVITNALPVVLIAIAVADAIHILCQYYEEVRDKPQASHQEIIVGVMVKMWRPVIITSVTTIAGFLAIAASSYMPPMMWFGIFAGIGVLIALVYALFFIPSALMHLRPEQSKGLQKTNGTDLYSRMMQAIGSVVLKYPKVILAVSVLIIGVGIYGASLLEENTSLIDSFQKSEPIVKADHIINTTTNGTSYLDILVETPEAGDLYRPENLQKMAALQQYFETLPHVKGSLSIADFIRKINRALHANDKAFDRIPEDADLIAQEFLIYAASGGPDDFENFVDSEYRMANIRISINSTVFRDKKHIIEKGQQYIQNHFNNEHLRAYLSGNAALEYSWLAKLGSNHFTGLAFSFFAVLLVASLSFRSLYAGVLTVIPVIISILFIYAIMGLTNIWLSMGTTMFASLALGVGVDFAVHTVDRMIFYLKDQKLSAGQAFSELYRFTGRALLFNFLALAFGFSLLMSSTVPLLVQFGLLIAVAVSGSFIASVTILPAIIYVVRPAFLFKPEKKQPLAEEYSISLGN